MTSFPANPKSKGSCLILHAGTLGDCVLTLHIAMAVRQAGYQVTVAARSKIAAWAARHKMIDQFIWLDRMQFLWKARQAWPDSNPSDCDSLGSFDLVISFLGNPTELVSNRLAEIWGPDRVIHIDPHLRNETIDLGIHITQQWLNEIKHRLDFKFETLDLKSLQYMSRTAPIRPMIKPPRNIIVHPGSGSRAKCCPIETMEVLTKGLLTRGINAKWMIGPDEVDRDGPEFQRRLERTAPVIFKESVDAAADTVVEVDAFIGNDSGMTHVAALTNVQTIVLFGPTDPRVWRPIGSNCSVFCFSASTELDQDWVESIISLVLSNRSVPS